MYIEFKGKCVRTGEWVAGDVYTTTGDTTLISTHIDNPNNQMHTRVTTLVDPKSVGQYINRKDKNDTKIYVGDIIDAHQTINGHSKFEVVWDDKKMCVGLEYYDPRVDIQRAYEYDVPSFFKEGFANDFILEVEYEVIGNIHD